MKKHQPIIKVIALGVIGLTLAASAHAQTDKIPVTTSSDEAKEAFLEGRQLAEHLRGTEAREYFKEAVEADPSFAWAHLGLANTSDTATEFWASLERAVELAGEASEGERLLILSFNAGVRSKPEKQREYCQLLVKAYPDDERAWNRLAQFHFGRQENEEAIKHYQRATQINSEFAPVYNQLGYAYRRVERFDDAEKAFQKYIALIPNEPNPYDSYAELLMKLGRFEESIYNYQKALDNDRYFTASLVGIGNNYIFMAEYDKARRTFGELRAQARNDSEKRQALFWTAFSHIHESNFDKAMERLDERYALSAAAGDLPTMAGDMNLMGTVLLESGQPDRALAKYDKAVALMMQADVPEEAKEATRRGYLYNAARVALAQGNVESAKSLARDYREQAKAKKLPGSIRQAHRLAGMIALNEKQYDKAVAELSQANQQNPQVLYYLAIAYWGQGATEQCREVCDKAAHFNGLAASHAFVRAKALKMLEETTN